jgi:hypothetical protein
MDRGAEVGGGEMKESLRCEKPEDCFLADPGWLREKTVMVPEPLKPPRDPVVFHPFATPVSVESTVTAIKAWAFGASFQNGS